MRSYRVLILTAAIGLTNALPSDVKHVRAEQDTYDFVIVGGGVTGLIVANRLTEEKKYSVLVVESGAAYDNPNIRLPYGATYALNDTLLWNNYTCEPEVELGNRTWNTRVAQVLGG